MVRWMDGNSLRLKDMTVRFFFPLTGKKGACWVNNNICHFKQLRQQHESFLFRDLGGLGERGREGPDGEPDVVSLCLPDHSSAGSFSTSAFQKPCRPARDRNISTHLISSSSEDFSLILTRMLRFQELLPRLIITAYRQKEYGLKYPIYPLLWACLKDLLIL